MQKLKKGNIKNMCKQKRTSAKQEDENQTKKIKLNVERNNPQEEKYDCAELMCYKQFENQGDMIHCKECDEFYCKFHGFLVSCATCEKSFCFHCRENMDDSRYCQACRDFYCETCCQNDKQEKTHTTGTVDNITEDWFCYGCLVKCECECGKNFDYVYESRASKCESCEKMICENCYVTTRCNHILCHDCSNKEELQCQDKECKSIFLYNM